MATDSSFSEQIVRLGCTLAQRVVGIDVSGGKVTGRQGAALFAAHAQHMCGEDASGPPLKA